MKQTVFALWLCLATLTTASADHKKLTAPEIYDLAMKASVEVLIGGRQEGSGWFASPDGYVVTAAHAVHNAKHAIEVTSPSVGRLPTELIALDRGHDIALLKVAARDKPFSFLAVNTDLPKPGDDVYLFGMAFFRHHMLIRGAIARKTPTFEYLASQHCYIRVMHIAAPSPPGTSGGCWIDETGQVIGNQSAFISKDNIGLGIALSAAPDAIASLVKNKKTVRTPTLQVAFEELGSQPVGFISRMPKGANGLVPVLPVKDGVAEKHGLVGDLLITHIEDTEIVFRDTMMEKLWKKKPGESVTLTVVEPDKHKKKKMTIPLSEL